MNIDLAALRAIEKEREVPVSELLRSIAGALLSSYLDYRGGSAGDNAKALSLIHISEPTRHVP